MYGHDFILAEVPKGGHRFRLDTSNMSLTADQVVGYSQMFQFFKALKCLFSDRFDFVSLKYSENKIFHYIWFLQGNFTAKKKKHL